MNHALGTAFLLPLACLRLLAAPPDYAGHIAELIDRAKLATLGPRGGNPRVQKSV
jgi:hypothetical protein